MVRVLAVSDETSDALLTDLDPVRSARLILACGDLPFDYLDALVNALEVPLVFVPGNHDPDLSGYRMSRARADAAGRAARQGAVAGRGGQRRRPDHRRGRAADRRARRVPAL